MRLLVKLRCVENSEYEMQYHYHLQGFIYNLLKGSKYDYIHGKEGYKFFCFSNIFPVTKLEKDNLHTLIISSPDAMFIIHLYDLLSQSWTRTTIEIGCMKFKIDHLKKYDIRLPEHLFTLMTGTPIVVRIRREKYNDFDIDLDGNYDWVYWRGSHPIDLFVCQVESNLAKKYSEFVSINHKVAEENSMNNSRPSNLFQKIKFKKQISTRIFMKGLEQVIIGTVWEFSFAEPMNRD